MRPEGLGGLAGGLKMRIYPYISKCIRIYPYISYLYVYIAFWHKSPAVCTYSCPVPIEREREKKRERERERDV